MKKLAIMFVMLLGSVATMQAQTFDFSCAEEITSSYDTSSSALIINDVDFGSGTSSGNYDIPTTFFTTSEGYIDIYLVDGILTYDFNTDSGFITTHSGIIINDFITTDEAEFFRILSQ